MGPELLALALIVGAIGTGVNAFGQYQAGQKKKEIDYANAALADQASYDAIDRGNEAAQRIRGQGNRIEGAQRVAYAANGFDLGSESVQATMEGTRAINEQDIRTVKLNASREAWGFKKQAENLRKGGDAAAQAGTLNAVGTTLLGTNDLLVRWGMR